MESGSGTESFHEGASPIPIPIPGPSLPLADQSLPSSSEGSSNKENVGAGSKQSAPMSST